MGNAPSDSNADAEEENNDQSGINNNPVSKKEYDHQFTENQGPGKKLREKYNNFASGMPFFFRQFHCTTVFASIFPFGLENCVTFSHIVAVCACRTQPLS